MDRKGAGFAALALAGLLMVGTACGGGSDKNETSSEGKVTATTEASSSGASDDSSSSGDDTNSSGSSSSGFLDSDCQAAVAAYSSIFTSALTGSSAVSDEDQQRLEDEVATLKEKVPSELEGDIATVSDAYKAYFDALGDLDVSDLAKGGGSQIEEASQQLDSSEFKDAQTNIEDFFKDNCPTMAGSLG